jgi:peptidoglycan hydrolase-like protein with peptidoglycan-binding domain
VYPEGIISGFYGPLTTAAVQRFQCKYGIVCTGSVTTTGYGRVGPATLAKIQSLESQTPGVPNTGGTLDESAPIMTPETLTVSSTTAVIRWTTNEPALNSVLYASVWPFYLGTAPSATSGIGMNANVVLTGLVPNHTYRYVRQSVDMAGNVQYGFGGSFTTSSN